MADLLTGDDKSRDLHGHRPYPTGRQDWSGDYRFARTHATRGIRMRSALRLVNGNLKTMIEAIADSKVRRMQRDRALLVVRFDPLGDNRAVRLSEPMELKMKSSAVVSLLGVVRALVTFFSPSWDGPIKRYRPEEHYMRGPGPKFREKHSLGRTSPG